MWDPGWDEPPRSPSAPGSGPSESPDDAGQGEDDRTGWLAESDGPRPGRWYAPTTSRGKLLLVLTVALILVVTLLACCIGVAGLARLRSVDPTGLL